MANLTDDLKRVPLFSELSQRQLRHLAHDFKEIDGGEHSWSVWDPELGIFFDLLETREGWRPRRQ